MNDGPSAPFAIAYSARYSQVYGYVRAVQASGERSARVLALSGEAAELNPAHYTVWSLRRQCLDALVSSSSGSSSGSGSDSSGSDAAAWSLAQELEWLAALIRRMGSWKNYQVWHHRRLVVERLGNGSGELDFTAEAFADDAKNYHAWSHRQWAVQALTAPAAAAGAAEGGACAAPGSWHAEREFAAALLGADVRNNSAWNHRWFALTRGGGAPRALPRARWPAPAELAQEVAFAVAALGRVRRNEAAWSHLRACVLLARTQAPAASAPASGTMEDLRCAPAEAGWGAWPHALALAEECVAAAAAAASSSEDAGGACSGNALACEVLAEHAEASGDAAGAQRHYARAAEGDPIRAQYWKWREGRALAGAVAVVEQ